MNRETLGGIIVEENTQCKAPNADVSALLL